MACLNMSNRYILILNSHFPDVQSIQSCVNRLPFLCTPVVSLTAGDALFKLSSRKYDLLFVDTHLPDRTGLEFLQSVSQRPPAIVTANTPDLALDCFDLDVADYLLKPITFSRFIRAVNRALQMQINPYGFSDNKAVYLKIGRSIQRFRYDEIEYIEAFGVYSKVWRNQKATIVNEPISMLETHLPSQYFMRVHKSYIIGLNCLDTFSHTNIMIGGSKIPLGASYRPKFEGLLRLLLSTNGED